MIREVPGKGDVAGSAPLPTSSRSDLPPLRVHHFIAWTTATALLISGCLAFDRWARNGPPTEDPFVIVSLLLVAIGVSGALAATGWGLVWRARGRAFPVEPGQWLLVEISLLVIGFVLWVGGSFVMLWVHDDLIEPFQATWGIFVLVAFACLHLYVGWKRCDTRAWQVAVLSVWLAPILPVTLPWAVIDDVKRRRIRHWTHWFGVALFAAWIILSLGGVIRDEYF